MCRFLSLDIDARGWAAVADRDPVIVDAQQQLPGLRPCGFHSPYEAAAWAVLSQRIRIVQAARIRDDLVDRHGDNGAFPAPERLRQIDLDLPGRKPEYLHAVADAALDGRLSGAALRAVDPDEAITALQEIKSVGLFAAELVVLRGANAPDVPPRNERRLEAEITERYGSDRGLAEASQAWRPYRTWAAVHLRVLREQRTQEIARPGRRLRPS
ncbi:MAG: DNA-3-methyladenine glycosylase family protein [Jatrophihabitans sp.]